MENKITLDLDKPRQIQLDLGTIKLLEKHTGKSLFNGEIFQSVNTQTVCDLLFCGLVRAGEEVTLEEIDSMIHLKNFGKVFKQLKGEMTDFLELIKEMK